MTKLRIKKGDVIYLCETAEGYSMSPYDKDFIEQMKTVIRVNEAKSVGLKYQITLGENDLSSMGYLVESLTPR